MSDLFSAMGLEPVALPSLIDETARRRMDEARRLPHVAGSVTSLDAAASMKSRAGAVRERVYEALTTPRTDEELIEHLKGNPSTIRPRRVELVKAGRVVESGTRRTRSGRQAVVWAQSKADG